MLRKIKKILAIILVAVIGLTLFACGQKGGYNGPVQVSLVSDGEVIETIDVSTWKNFDLEKDPEKEGFLFAGLYKDEDFTESISAKHPGTKEIKLYIKWVEAIPITLKSFEQQEVIKVKKGYPMTKPVGADQPGKVLMSWIVEGETKPYDFRKLIEGPITLVANYGDGINLVEVKELPFKNLSREYEVAEGTLKLYYAEGGSVPYVNPYEFLKLLKGFIDPEIQFEVENEDGVISIAYDFYSEEDDYTFHLTFEANSKNNSIEIKDPGFLWAYVNEPETNYGRNIVYDNENENNHRVEGFSVNYDLGKYGFDVVEKDGQVLLPYAVVNQLIGGATYYNVYYNGDALYGIYEFPRDSLDEVYQIIRETSLANTEIPEDMIQHNIDFLVFALDYFYGLREWFNIDDFYDFVKPNMGGLTLSNPEKIDTAIKNIVMLDFDEMHTSFGMTSYYNHKSKDSPTYAGSPQGPRFRAWLENGLWRVDDAVKAKWGIKDTGIWGFESPLRPDYWFVDDKTVVVSLDGFSTLDIEEANKFDQSIIEKILDVNKIDLPKLNGEKYYFINKNDELKGKLAEVLVSGLLLSQAKDFEKELKNKGFELVKEETTEAYKEKGYYKKQIGDKTLMLQTTYDKNLKLLYVGIADHVPETYKEPWPFKMDVRQTVLEDSAVYLEYTLAEAFRKKPNLEHIALDLTYNTGGNVGALYRVLGIITGKPFGVSSINGDTRSKTTTFITTENMTQAYHDKRWSLLTSKATFSAGNELVTIFKQNNLGKIYGEKSGGGACSITPILLPIGTSLMISSNQINALRTGSGTADDPFVYHNNEGGIDPDVVISIEELFDEAKLKEAFK